MVGLRGMRWDVAGDGVEDGGSHVWMVLGAWLQPFETLNLRNLKRFWCKTGGS